MLTFVLLALLRSVSADPDIWAPSEAMSIRWEPCFDGPTLRVTVHDLEGPLTTRVVVRDDANQELYAENGPGAIVTIETVDLQLSDANDRTVVLMSWDTGGSGSCKACGVFDVFTWDNGKVRVSSIHADRARPLVLDVDNDGLPEVFLTQRVGKRLTFDVYRWRGERFERAGSVPIGRVTGALQRYGSSHIP